VDATLDLASAVLGRPVTLVRDRSWDHGEATVLEVRDAGGTPWIVKRVGRPQTFERETRALRDWAPLLGDGRAPRLEATDPERSLLVMNRLPGRACVASTTAEFRQAGRLIRRLHDAEPATPDPDYPARAGVDVDRWLHRVPGVADRADVDFVRAQIALMGSMPPALTVPVHNDNQPRNWLSDADGTVRVIDFGKARRDILVRDFERMQQAEWRDRPDLRDAFLDGYGRPLTDAEERMLACVGAVAALTTVLWGRAHGDRAFEDHGRRTLRRLATAPS
jgi:Ser/Thr protein kinase RdoA (MazF antagonist)